jgi:pimeloyl-ACP methyl ester carboxylesterase
MKTRDTGILPVPGASLYYEVRGTGPALLVIATGNGDATPFGPMADALADGFTVITYDRRGFSRSVLDGPVDDDTRLESEVDDALRLLSHVPAPGPKHVYATCSGGIIALALAQRQLSDIATVVVHEPPTVTVLPDGAHWLKFHDELYETYKHAGIGVARVKFRAYAGLIEQTRPPKEYELPADELAIMMDRLNTNQVFWFEHELLTYPAFVPDKSVLAVTPQLVLAGGSMSRGLFCRKPTDVLAEQLGVGVVSLPGGHLGHVTHPVEFADGLAGILNRALTR